MLSSAPVLLLQAVHSSTLDRHPVLDQQVHTEEPVYQAEGKLEPIGTERYLTRFLNIKVEYQQRLLNIERRYLKWFLNINIRCFTLISRVDISKGITVFLLKILNTILNILNIMLDTVSNRLNILSLFKSLRDINLEYC